MQGNPQGNWFGWNPNMGRPQQQKAPSMWVPVSSLEEAKNVFVSPGETKWIMILNAMMFAVKSVNEAGATDFQAYDFVPHVEQPQVPQQNGSISMDDVMGTSQNDWGTERSGDGSPEFQEALIQHSLAVKKPGYFYENFFAKRGLQVQLIVI